MAIRLIRPTATTLAHHPERRDHPSNGAAHEEAAARGRNIAGASPRGAPRCPSGCPRRSSRSSTASRDARNDAPSRRSRQRAASWRSPWWHRVADPA